MRPRWPREVLPVCKLASMFMASSSASSSGSHAVNVDGRRLNGADFRPGQHRDTFAELLGCGTSF